MNLLAFRWGWKWLQLSGEGVAWVGLSAEIRSSQSHYTKLAFQKRDKVWNASFSRCWGIKKGGISAEIHPPHINLPFRLRPMPAQAYPKSPSADCEGRVTRKPSVSNSRSPLSAKGPKFNADTAVRPHSAEPPFGPIKLCNGVTVPESTAQSFSARFVKLPEMIDPLIVTAPALKVDEAVSFQRGCAALGRRGSSAKISKPASPRSSSPILSRFGNAALLSCSNNLPAKRGTSHERRQFGRN